MAELEGRQLDGRQERFCVEYVKDPKRNQARAAIRAGYSEDSAYNQGCRLMKYDYILRRVKELEREALEEAGYSVESLRAFIIRQMIAHASVDASDISEVVYADNEKRTAALEKLAECNNGQYFLDFGDPVVYIKPTSEWTAEERAAVKCIKQTRTKEGISLEVQMYDKQAALKALADIAGISKQNLDVALAGAGGQPVELNFVMAGSIENESGD